VGNWVNWLLVIVGIVCVIVELALGALTGFDLALVGGCLAVGGAIGLFAVSPEVGLIAGAALALLYFVVFRSWLKSKLTVRTQLSNVDAVVGKTGVVTKRIVARDAGLIKVGAEEWRAELLNPEDSARDVGATVVVNAVEGVTLKVR